MVDNRALHLRKKLHGSPVLNDGLAKDNGSAKAGAMFAAASSSWDFHKTLPQPDMQSATKNFHFQNPHL